MEEERTTPTQEMEQGLVPSAHISGFTTACNSRSRDQRPPQVLQVCDVQIDMRSHARKLGEKMTGVLVVGVSMEGFGMAKQVLPCFDAFSCPCGSLAGS